MTAAVIASMMAAIATTSQKLAGSSSQGDSRVTRFLEPR